MLTEAQQPETAESSSSNATALAVYKQARKKLKLNFKAESKIENLYTGGKITVSNDGKLLACPCGDQVKIFDLETSKVKRVIDAEGETITAFALSPDATKLVIASANLQQKYWDLETGTCLRTWKGHDGPVLCLSFESTGTLIASGSADKSIKIFDVEKGYFTHNFRGHQGIITSLSFHPESHRLQLISGSEDSTVRIWDLNTGSSKILTDHMSTVTSIAFSKSGWELVTGSRDKVAIIWDLRTFTKVKTIPVFEPIESLQLFYAKIPFLPKSNYSPKQGYMLTGGEKGLVKIWEISSGTCVFEEKQAPGLKYSIVQMILLPELYQLIIVTSDQNLLFLELQEFKKTKLLVGFNDEVIDVKYMDENGPRIAVATNSEQIRIFNTKDSNCNILAGHTGIVLSLDVNIKAGLLASGSKDHTIRIWKYDDQDVRCVSTCIGHTEPVTAVAFSKRNANLLISGSQDKTIKLWEVSEKHDTNVVHTQIAHDKDINSVAFSPNDKLIASGSQDRTIKLWNSKDLTLVSTLKGHKRGVWSVEFSPVEQCLVSSSSDKTIKIWSVIDFSCLKTLEGHSNSVLRVCFINNGLQLMSCGSDGLLKLWTIKNNECVNTFDSHEDRIWALAVSKDESEVITGGADSLINIWKDVTVQEEENALRANEERVLKEQELSNCLFNKNFKRALEIAFALEQPYRIFTIFDDLYSQKLPDWEQVVTQVIGNFSIQRLETCLRYISTWNTNAKHSATAMKTLRYILSLFEPSTIEQIHGIKEILEGLIPYTERHFQRVDKLLQKSFILDYTLQSLGPASVESDGVLKTILEKKKKMLLKRKPEEITNGGDHVEKVEGEAKEVDGKDGQKKKRRRKRDEKGKQQ